MATFQKSFYNENNNSVFMKVENDDRGITVTAHGPTSDVEHTWTPMEAIHLRDMLSVIITEELRPMFTEPI